MYGSRPEVCAQSRGERKSYWELQNHSCIKPAPAPAPAEPQIARRDSPSVSGFNAELCWKRAVIDSGEFIVIVVAVKTTSHDQRLSLLASASRSILLKTSLMRGGAGVGSGRASAAVVTDLSVNDSFIAMCEGGQVEGGV
jgi:hypothetical protein